MGSKALIYRQKLQDNLNESKKHLQRLDEALTTLQKKYLFPLDKSAYSKIVNNLEDLAFSDQTIYRFSKLQDSMGAKLFKSLLLYQGENIDKPFLDILNQLEKMEILEVDEWFEIRDLRNEISHEYDDNEEEVIEILNMIYQLKDDMALILEKIERLIK